MNAFSFGRFVAEKVAAGPAGGLITSGSKPLQGPNPMSPKPMGSKPSASTNPSFMQSYGNVLDRWYNPFTKQRNYERGEKGLMRAGQAAMGIGAAAGAAAGGVAAAAPTLAATPVSSLPAYFAGNAAAAGTVAGAGAGGAAATQSPTAQRMFPTMANAASSAANSFNRFATDGAMRVNDLKNTLWKKLPHSAREFHETIEHHPFAQALDPNTGIAKHMNPVNTSGNLMGLLPHSVTLPYEGMHEGAHGLQHTLHNFVGGGHGGVEHAGVH